MNGKPVKIMDNSNDEVLFIGIIENVISRGNLEVRIVSYPPFEKVDYENEDVREFSTNEYRISFNF